MGLSLTRCNGVIEDKKNPAEGRMISVERFQESVLVSTPEVSSALLTAIKLPDFACNQSVSRTESQLTLFDRPSLRPRHGLIPGRESPGAKSPVKGPQACLRFAVWS